MQGGSSSGSASLRLSPRGMGAAGMSIGGSSSSSSSKHRYSKDQVLEAFSATMPAPDGLSRHEVIFLHEAATPASRVALSDAEKVRTIYSPIRTTTAPETLCAERERSFVGAAQRVYAHAPKLCPFWHLVSYAFQQELAATPGHFVHATTLIHMPSAVGHLQKDMQSMPFNSQVPYRRQSYEARPAAGTAKFVWVVLCGQGEVGDRR